MKRIFLLCIITLIVCFISGCEGKPATTVQTVLPEDDRPAYGDALIEGSIGEPSVLIPMLAGDSASFDIAGLVFNGLVKYDTDLSIIGDLAKSWDISKDGLAITFHLRKGVMWTDGVEFTADDVMYGYKTIIDPKTPTAYSEDFKQVKKAEVLDRYTFRVTYDKPFAPALSSWASALVILPKHLLEGKDITKSDLTRNPVGMGPYKLNRWITGQELILDSNRQYFEGRPYIDHFIYRIIPDPATMFLELQTGGIDMMGLTPIQYTKQTETDFLQKELSQIPLSSIRLYIYGIQPETSFFQRQTSKTGYSICHRQERDHRRRPLRTWKSCHRTLCAQYMAVQSKREEI